MKSKVHHLTQVVVYMASCIGPRSVARATFCLEYDVLGTRYSLDGTAVAIRKKLNDLRTSFGVYLPPISFTKVIGDSLNGGSLYKWVPEPKKRSKK